MDNIDFLFAVNNSFNKKGVLFSIKQIINFLKSLGYKSDVIDVSDYSFLNFKINETKPKVLFIETIWLHPNKLKKILSNNKFIKSVIIHLHSDIAFLAAEMFAFEWIFFYKEISDKIKIVVNSKNFADAFDKNLIEYLPNLYKEKFNYEKTNNENIIFFQPGVIRILKNHLTQLISIINFSKKINKNFIYKINNIYNNGGEAVFNNILNIKNNLNYNIEFINWSNKDEYINLIKQTDVGLQLSFTESFNNVAADFVVNGKPVLVGDTIDWLPEEYICSSYIKINKIVEKLEYLYNNKDNLNLLYKAYNFLQEFNKQSEDIWKKFLENVY